MTREEMNSITLRSVGSGSSTGLRYEMPPQPNTRRIRVDYIEDAIDVIKDLERVYSNYKKKVNSGEIFNTEYYIADDISVGVLRYLSKPYLEKGYVMRLLKNVFVTAKDEYFNNYLRDNYKNLYYRLENYIGEHREEVKDSCGGLNDIAHLAFSTLMKLIRSTTPDYWASWGGDLATGMEDLHYYNKKYPGLDLQALSDSLIGAYPGERSRYLINNGIYLKGDDGRNKIQCNFVDLCDDADSIALAYSVGRDKDYIYSLSSSMENYYKGLSMRYRFEQYKYDGFEIDRPRAMKEMLIGKVANNHIDLNAFDHLKGNATTYEKECACDSLALYIYTMCK